MRRVGTIARIQAEWAHPNKPAAQFILDMDPDDLLERVFGLANPTHRARASKRRGQPATIVSTTGRARAGCGPTTSSPATLRSAAICSATVTASARHGELRGAPSARGIDRRGVAHVADRGARARRASASRSSDIGSTPPAPASGSRMMLEKKPEAALLGLPGRTQMVGSRMLMPSKKPRAAVIGDQQFADGSSACRSRPAAC